MSSADLVEWLNAQIAEDERVARAAAPGVWSASYCRVDAETDVCGDDCMWRRDATHEAPHPTMTIYDEGGHNERDAEHIVNWQPARVLAECEAKKRIIGMHTDFGPHECVGGWHDTAGLIYTTGVDCNTVRLLALPYADRPGYQENWRP